jgi:hypothetical protein
MAETADDDNTSESKRDQLARIFTIEPTDINAPEGKRRLLWNEAIIFMAPYFGGSEETAERWLKRRLDRREIAWWCERLEVECNPVVECLDPPFFVQMPPIALRYFWRQQSESTITVDRQTNEAIRIGPAIIVYPDHDPELPKPLFDRRYEIKLHAVMVEVYEEHIVMALCAAGRMPQSEEPANTNEAVLGAGSKGIGSDGVGSKVGEDRVEGEASTADHSMNQGDDEDDEDEDEDEDDEERYGRTAGPIIEVIGQLLEQGDFKDINEFARLDPAEQLRIVRKAFAKQRPPRQLTNKKGKKIDLRRTIGRVVKALQEKKLKLQEKRKLQEEKKPKEVPPGA